jgi:hypothetical protein
MLDLDAMFAPIRTRSYSTVMIAREIPGDREAQTAFITATLEGTLAGASPSSRRRGCVQCRPAARRQTVKSGAGGEPSEELTESMFRHMRRFRHEPRRAETAPYQSFSRASAIARSRSA